MLKNHIKIAWRNLQKNKGYFVINTLGLSVALCVAFLMLLWVQDEYQVDAFHDKDAQLYRVKRTIPLEGGELDVYEGISYPLLAQAKIQIPEIEKFIPIGATWEDNLKVNEIDYRAKGTFANTDLFESLSFPVLLGDISQLDKSLESIAISERLAYRIWGEAWKEKALGSSLEILDNGLFTVHAIYQDPPPQSTLQNEFYFSLNKYLKDNDWMLEWANNGMQGAYLLREDANPNEVANKLNTLFQENIKGENKEGVFLQKFSEDHLYGKFDEQGKVIGGRIEYVRVFTVAAIFLLLISCINFINLASAHATKRANEIGVRKVVGAGKRILISQFLTETALITIFSIVIGVTLTQLLLPEVNVLVNKEITIAFGQPFIWICTLAIFVVTTLLSGLYPAVIISSFKPITALKGEGMEHNSTLSFRKALVVLQFGLTILLIVSAVVVRLQIEYIQNKELGIQKEQLLTIHQDAILTDNYEVLRNTLLTSNSIEDVTLAGPSPLNMNASTSGLNWPGKTIDEENIEFSLLWTAHNFHDVFDVPLKEGHYYREGSLDTLNIVLNEAAVAIMNIDHPIGKKVEMWGRPRQIIGVLKDFHNRSLYEPIQPAVFLLNAENAGMMVVKMKAGKTAEAIAALDKAFKDILPTLPLHYEFVDEVYEKAYTGERLTSSLAYLFAIISIFISCLGLFGLATFMAKQRTKEIGIRKVLGASVASITALISKEFMRLVLIAIGIASPIAYYFMSIWLEEFTYKITIQWWVFGLTAVLAVLVTIATIGIQSVKAAMANPIKSLRID